jgi:hypothetical protein
MRQGHGRRHYSKESIFLFFIIQPGVCRHMCYYLIQVVIINSTRRLLTVIFVLLELVGSWKKFVYFNHFADILIKREQIMYAKNKKPPQNIPLIIHQIYLSFLNIYLCGFILNPGRWEINQNGILNNMLKVYYVVYQPYCDNICPDFNLVCTNDVKEWYQLLMLYPAPWWNIALIFCQSLTSQENWYLRQCKCTIILYLALVLFEQINCIDWIIVCYISVLTDIYICLVSLGICYLLRPGNIVVNHVHFLLT